MEKKIQKKRVLLMAAEDEHGPIFEMLVDADRFSEDEADVIFRLHLEEKLYLEGKDRNGVSLSPILSGEWDALAILDPTTITGLEKEKIYQSLEEYGYVILPLKEECHG